MTERHQAIVIGSGFGGAVAACRLTQAGLDVAVIERGRRYPRGSFPRDPANPKGWMWGLDGGLIDARPLSEVLVVQCAGYGGGSLIYANVAFRPPADLFEGGWPAGYSRAALDPYYDLAAYMLDISPVSEDRLPPKAALMRDVATRLGRGEQFFFPNLAIGFGEQGKLKKNRFGVPQSGCTYCGECDIGCNEHAKNTLDLNYLALAEKGGATVHVETEVTGIEKVGDDFVVHVHDRVAGEDRTLTAPHVFVCTGAVNSTELLLRCRDHDKTLPGLSRALGTGYSGNGDFLSFAFDLEPPAFEPTVGPSITTGMIYDDKASSERRWFVLEEGGYPQLSAVMLQLLNPGDLARVALNPAELARRWKDLGSRLKDVTNGTAVFLTMGRDQANGIIELTGDGTPRIRWDVPSNLPLYEVQAAMAQDVAHELNGRYEANPAWTHLNQVATVHSLGGCRMADSPADGVVDPDGQVYGYPGLWVLDGSIIPTATGANPSHTITAVAERCIERAIRGITGQQDWVAPERKHARPIALPEDAAAPVKATAPPRSQLVGLRFTETMKGTLVAHGDATSQTPLAARFKVTITSTDLAKLIADEAHPAVATGTVSIDGYTAPGGAPIVGGAFNLFTHTDTPSRRKMLYSLPFVATNGHRYVLQGNKEIWDHGGFDLWGSTTTLYSSLVPDEGDPAVPALATGILRLNLPMLARQATTVRITGTSNPLVQVERLGGFLRFFGTTLTDVFVRPKVKA